MGCNRSGGRSLVLNTHGQAGRQALMQCAMTLPQPTESPQLGSLRWWPMQRI